MNAPQGLDRRAAVRSLLAERGDLLVISGLGSSSYDLFAAGDHDGNFYLWGAMGGAAMMGLGLAMAQPDRPVLVLTGDGEQLMAAGALITLGVRRPGNLTLAVLDNGQYGETGFQDSHTGLGVSLSAAARAAGVSEAVDITDMAGLEALRPRLQQTQGGPRMAVIRVAGGEIPRTLPPRKPSGPASTGAPTT